VVDLGTYILLVARLRELKFIIEDLERSPAAYTPSQIARKWPRLLHTNFRDAGLRSERYAEWVCKGEKDAATRKLLDECICGSAQLVSRVMDWTPVLDRKLAAAQSELMALLS
jgi:hypothetical protein